MRPFLLSARARIVGWMILVVAAALGGAVLVTSQLVAVRADALATENLEHEAENFRTFADSRDGRSQSSVAGLLESYLAYKVPDAGETYFTMLNGQPYRRSAVQPPARMDRDAAFIAHITAADAAPTGWWESEAGRVRYGVIPVTVAGDDDAGALVVAEFRDVQARPLIMAVTTFAAVSALALIVAASASWAIAGRVLEPVRLVRRTAEQISDTDLSRRIPVEGTDDIARLATTFNRMLDRLEATFDTQRAFLDNTSHELRTPIAVVRGHVELLQAQAAGRSPADDPHETIALVLDELDRMHRIVEDIMVLARAERPNFLHLAPTNLADVTIDALSAIRVTADRTWELDAIAEATVRADEQRLSQAMLALTSNAVKYTAAGDRISVGSSYDAGTARLWVADDGVGVPAAESAAIFERFRRGSHTTRVEGSGLGLAIVAAIAEAHGGSARHEQPAGAGARFVIEFPAAEIIDTDEQEHAPHDPPRHDPPRSGPWNTGTAAGGPESPGSPKE